MKLSVIIPFGLSEERIYLKDRIIQKVKEYKSDKDIEYIFVEGFSSLKSDIKEIIKKYNHIYIKDESQIKYFSQGKCRNLGAIYANSNVLMFLDADCYISNFSLKKILNLIKIKNIYQNLNEFMVLPVIYLSKYGSSYIYNHSINLWDDIIKNDLISGKREYIKFYSLVSSTIILNKYTFLNLGGYNDEFIGHSYEDFDFLARLIFSCVEFEKMPKMLCFDEGDWNLNKFRGFRAWFSLIGEEMSFHGIYIYHFYHIEPNQNNYMSNMRKNHKKFYKNIENIKDYKINKLLAINDFENKKLNFEKKYIPLNSLVYNRYIYEIKNKKYNFFYIFDFFNIKFSQTKFFRLFKKFLKYLKNKFK